MAETWLSQEAHNRLAAELEQLKTTGRERASADIEEARAHGDLRENAEYHAAKDAQGQMEARIRQLESLLRDARIGEPPDAGEVRPGLVVTLDVDGDSETYLLGSREEAASSELEVLSAESPMGKAILGCREGDSASFSTPTGVELKVTVTAIKSAS